MVISKVNREATVHLTANATVSLANTALAGETVSALGIKEVFWSGTWTVTRNEVKVLDLANAGHFNLKSSGISLDIEANSSLVCAGSGTLILKLSKLT